MQVEFLGFLFIWQVGLDEKFQEVHLLLYTHTKSSLQSLFGTTDFASISLQAC